MGTSRREKNGNRRRSRTESSLEKEFFISTLNPQTRNQQRTLLAGPSCPETTALQKIKWP